MHGRYEQDMAAKHEKKKRKDFAFWRQFDEKPSMMWIMVSDRPQLLTKLVKVMTPVRGAVTVVSSLKTGWTSVMDSNPWWIKTHHAAAVMQCALKAKGKLHGHLL